MQGSASKLSPSAGRDRWKRLQPSILCRTKHRRDPTVCVSSYWYHCLVHQKLIELGAVTLMVPGNLPIGCSSSYLTLFKGSNKEEYDPETGCLTWLNKFAEYHNELLRNELNVIQQLNPHATIIYADYYNAAMQLYRSPNKFGFTRGALSACCGGGGSYNYNPSVLCGIPPSTVSGEPSLYVNWDGLHLTEAAYRWIFRGLFEGPYTIPQINTLCGSRALSA
ncbi:hypothetical protein RJ640_002645 [Escallonia rubra]|uniref:GDSL esterase/lipase n=1 Tax=Escallonia rubra TaxID=112253 RepID=A0AA88S520_9ASTE|nr:hypothetical protein RJ640_002645 [Escallonia rubra]